MLIQTFKSILPIYTMEQDQVRLRIDAIHIYCLLYNSQEIDRKGVTQRCK